MTFAASTTDRAERTLWIDTNFSAIDELGEPLAGAPLAVLERFPTLIVRDVMLRDDDLTLEFDDGSRLVISNNPNAKGSQGWWIGAPGATLSESDSLWFPRPGTVTAHGELLTLMETLSEDAYAAGWMGDLEYDLWAIVDGQRPREYGRITVSEEAVTRLRELSEQAGGWWAWSDEFDAVFVPLRAWRREAARHARSDGQ